MSFTNHFFFVLYFFLLFLYLSWIIDRSRSFKVIVQVSDYRALSYLSMFFDRGFDTPLRYDHAKRMIVTYRILDLCSVETITSERVKMILRNDFSVVLFIRSRWMYFKIIKLRNWNENFNWYFKIIFWNYILSN